MLHKSDPPKTSLQKIPVTILTGFLGSGKTTLLNRILKENNNQRIAVIENEFGEVGVDNDLVIGAREEIFEMNNGCICCTIRGDLIRMLNSLLERRDSIDYILIETTGLADPGPLTQTFFLEKTLQQSLYIDSIVTVVDAKFMDVYFDDNHKITEQIAFADVILLNKTDLVDEKTLGALEARIRTINNLAPIHKTINTAIDLKEVLNVGRFKLNRALSIDPGFLQPEYPFEWAGMYYFQPGRYQWKLMSGRSAALNAALIPVIGTPKQVPESVIKIGYALFSEPEHLWRSDSNFDPRFTVQQLEINGTETLFMLQIEHPGYYVLISEQNPDNFRAQLLNGMVPVEPHAKREFKHQHKHDGIIESVGITVAGELKKELLEPWLQGLLAAQGQDIFRMKGVVNIQNYRKRYVFQGVHMLLEGTPDRFWGEEKRRNNMAFIGKNLNRDFLNEGLKACLA